MSNTITYISCFLASVVIIKERKAPKVKKRNLKDKAKISKSIKEPCLKIAVHNYFIPFCATVKTVTSEVLWVTRWHCCTRHRAIVPSGYPQHLGCDSFDCCTERYEIHVAGFFLLPNLLYAEVLSIFDCLASFRSLPVRSGFEELFPVRTF